MTDQLAVANADFGVPESPRFVEVKTDVHPGIRGHSRVFTFMAPEGLVGGIAFNVSFTVDHPIEKVWPVLKDWNRWQNQAGLYYSAVVGDLAPGELFLCSDSLVEETDLRHSEFEEEESSEVKGEYTIVRVVPEQMMAVDQPVPKTPEMGLGLVPFGFHVFTVDEDEGTTTVFYGCQHESVMALPQDAAEVGVEAALAPWLGLVEHGIPRWYDSLIPTFRDAVAEAG